MGLDSTRVRYGMYLYRVHAPALRSRQTYLRLQWDPIQYPSLRSACTCTCTCKSESLSRVSSSLAIHPEPPAADLSISFCRRHCLWPSMQLLRCASPIPRKGVSTLPAAVGLFDWML